MKNKKMVLWIALMVTEMLLLGCSKKAEAQENPKTGSAKTVVYNSESDFETKPYFNSYDEDDERNGTIIITAYKGNAKIVNIPEKIKGEPVIIINENAFANTNITSVTIPNTVTYIAKLAFKDCSKLTNITIPDSVVGVGQGAFSNCTSLTTVNIGKGFNGGGVNIFFRCINLKTINIDSDNERFSSANGMLLSKDKTILYEYPSASGTFTIPDSVTEIGDLIFAENTRITNITIPNSVTEIGLSAFRNCTSLTSINIPSSVTKIRDGVFARCTSLTSVTFENGSNIQDTDFGKYAFPEGGDDNYYDTHNTLKTAYSTGKAGTYTRQKNGSTWTKK